MMLPLRDKVTPFLVHGTAKKKKKIFFLLGSNLTRITNWKFSSRIFVRPFSHRGEKNWRLKNILIVTYVRWWSFIKKKKKIHFCIVSFFHPTPRYFWEENVLFSTWVIFWKEISEWKLENITEWRKIKKLKSTWTYWEGTSNMNWISEKVKKRTNLEGWFWLGHFNKTWAHS